MFHTVQRLARQYSRGGSVILIVAMGLIHPLGLLCQGTNAKTPPTKRSAPPKKALPSNARIELTVLAALPNGRSSPVAGHEFLVLAVDPDVLKAQIEKEIPLPEDQTPSPRRSLPASNLEQLDIQRVAQEFKVSPEFVMLAQKAPQAGSSYRDEPKYRRLEDYAQVEELRKGYDLILKKRGKKGNLSNLTDNQRLDLAKALDIDFNRLPPVDKTSIAIRLAQLAVERENQSFAERRRQIEQKNAVLHQRAKRQEELFKELEQKKRLFRTRSDAKGLARFLRLPPGNY